MSLSKIKKFISPKRFFPELLSTNEKFLFELRTKLMNSNKNLNELETKKLFTAKKYFNNDVFMTGLKNHVLEFNNFKNQILMKIFGYETKRGGFSFINMMVKIYFIFFIILF